MTLENKKTINSGFSSPGIYCIKVRGKINESYESYFSGMKIKTEEKDGKSPITTLIGKLKDQSALSGIFNALYNLRLTVISVETIKS